MTNREKDIQELCKQVLNILPNVHYSNHGSDCTTCPLCGSYVRWEEDIEKLPHEPNCAYLIAKDLSTNLKDEK